MPDNAKKQSYGLDIIAINLKAGRRKVITGLLPCLVVVLICTGTARAQQAHHGNDGPALLPDLAVTPGNVSTTSKVTVCTTKWEKDERHESMAGSVQTSRDL